VIFKIFEKYNVWQKFEITRSKFENIFGPYPKSRPSYVQFSTSP